MDVCVLYSGGKDSNYALYWALNQGWGIKQLVSFKPRRDDSFMFHVPCIDLTGLAAEALGLPYVSAEVSGIAEDEVSEMTDVLSDLRVCGVVSGAVASDYQKTRIDAACEKLGVRSFTPLWHKNQLQLLKDIVSAGFDVIVAGVAADGFDESWLGRRIDEDCIRDLERLNEKHGINVAGEGGEYETLVVDGPTFKKKLDVEYRTEWDGACGRIIMESARLGA